MFLLYSRWKKKTTNLPSLFLLLSLHLSVLFLYSAMKTAWILSIFPVLLSAGLVMVILGQYQEMEMVNKKNADLQQSSNTINVKFQYEATYKKSLEDLLVRGEKTIKDLEATLAGLTPQLESKTKESGTCQEQLVNKFAPFFIFSYRSSLCGNIIYSVKKCKISVHGTNYETNMSIFWRWAILKRRAKMTNNWTWNNLVTSIKHELMRQARDRSRQVANKAKNMGGNRWKRKMYHKYTMRPRRCMETMT